MNVKHKGRTLVLGADDLITAKATWSESPEAQKHTALLLMDNLYNYRAQKLKDAIIAHVGHLPTLEKCERYLQMTQIEEQPIVWVWWRKTAIAVFTLPVSRIEGRWIILEQYYRQIVKNINPNNN